VQSVTRVLQLCRKHVTRVLQQCYSSVTVVFQKCHGSAMVVLQECYSSVNSVLSLTEHHKALQGAAKHSQSIHRAFTKHPQSMTVRRTSALSARNSMRYSHRAVNMRYLCYKSVTNVFQEC
jgi:hypothetical protein